MTWVACGVPYIPFGGFDPKCLLSTEIIRREYAATHNGETCELTAWDFPIEALSLSLDDFSRLQGWLK